MIAFLSRLVRFFVPLALLSILFSISVLPVSAPSAFAASHIPANINCGTNYDAACSGEVDWQGFVYGAKATVFYNRETAPAGVNVFIGVRITDYTTTGCKNLATHYCYIKVGMLHNGNNNSDVLYEEHYIIGYSRPLVSSQAMVTNDFGKNCAESIDYQTSTTNWFVTDVCATSGMSVTIPQPSGGMHANDIYNILQAFGTSVPFFTMPEDDMTFSQYKNTSTNQFYYQQNGGAILNSGVTCALWKIEPTFDNFGGSLKTKDTATC